MDERHGDGPRALTAVTISDTTYDVTAMNPVGEGVVHVAQPQRQRS